MKNEVLKAAELADAILVQPDGSYLLHLANIYNQLQECDLEDNERLLLTQRIDDAAGMSSIPLLTAERVDAVRFMLEYGISPNMSPELTTISAVDAKKLLLTCDMDVFADLVDTVGVDSHDYYAPELGSTYQEVIDRLNLAIDASKTNISLADKIRQAEESRQPENTTQAPQIKQNTR